MNDPALAFLEYLARCSAVGLVAMLLVSILCRRGGPESGAMAAHAGLLSLLMTAGLALVPWPTAWSLPSPWRPGADRLGITVENWTSPKEAPPKALPLARKISAPKSNPARAVVGNRVESRQSRSSLPVARRSPKVPGVEATPQGAPDGPRKPWRVATWISMLLVAGWTYGSLRFALGLVGLSRRVARSGAVNDPKARAIADDIRGSLGYSRAVSLLESDSVGLPATIGWFRPRILLPRGWRDWTDVELRVVLTHELAHVSRGDFAKRLASQFCLIVHFYHPIAHWLSARLRLQQELAADAWGIRLAGGRETYLTTLARMTLRHDARQVRKPDRSLLAFDGLLLRRIDMLCHQKTLGHSPASSTRRARLMTFGLLGIVALVATALRAPFAPAAARAAQEAARPEPPPQLKAGETPFDLSHVPLDAVGIVAIRPSALLAQQDIQSLLSLVRLMDGFKNELPGIDGLGLAPESIDQLIYVQMRADLKTAFDGELSVLRRGALIIKSKDPIDARAMSEAFGKIGGKVKVAIESPDGRTAIIGEESTLKELAKRKPGPSPRYAWSDAWAGTGVDRSQVAIAFDVAYARELTDLLAMDVAGGEISLFAAPVAPIWEDARGISIGLSLAGDQVEILSINTAATDQAAENTFQTVQALMTLARNAAGSINRPLRNALFLNNAGLEGLLMAKTAKLWANQVLQQIKVDRSGTSVRFAAKVDLDTLMILARLR